MYSFNKHRWRACSMPGTVLGASSRETLRMRFQRDRQPRAGTQTRWGWRRWEEGGEAVAESGNGRVVAGQARAGDRAGRRVPGLAPQAGPPSAPPVPDLLTARARGKVRSAAAWGPGPVGPREPVAGLPSVVEVGGSLAVGLEGSQRRMKVPEGPSGPSRSLQMGKRKFGGLPGVFQLKSLLGSPAA